ncbi:MAG TPA: capsule biosynthesis protein [Burkholderiales bacterium]|nr:capsule biosynthesis protein [Burkholderiales bacterium]
MLGKANSPLRLLKRRIERKLRAQGTGYPDWTLILERSPELWRQARAAAAHGPRVLIATTVGSHLPGTTLDSVLAVALTLRGANVELLLCDAVLPACLAADATWYTSMERFSRNGPQTDLCADCYAPACRMFEQLGLRIHALSNWVSHEERASAAKLAETAHVSTMGRLQHDGMAVGEHALAGTLRFFARGDLASEPQGEPILRRYVEGAVLSAAGARRLIRERNCETVVLHHGIYVPQGAIAEATRIEGKRVVTWNPAYRKQCFIFSHNDTYHHTLLDEPTGAWQNLRLTAEQEGSLMRYLQSRATGSADWIWFHHRPSFDRAALFRDLRIDPSRPIIGLLTNVVWDAQLHYPANVFTGMTEWLVETVRYFERHPQLQLLIRVHPAEIRGTLPSRQRIQDELRQAFPVLPRNVFVVPPESELSTYTAMSACDSVIVYGTKAGVELASIGVPVIVAGEAWVRNKGITIDPCDKHEYFECLSRLPLRKRMSEEATARARLYAYHFFFRRMIPLEFMEPVSGWPPYRPAVQDLGQLCAGKSRGLDVICDGILAGKPFIFPAETFPDSHRLHSGEDLTQEVDAQP